MNQTDHRIVMTLDAGGTNFVFSAMSAGEEILTPFVLPSCASELSTCLDHLVDGFQRIRDALPQPPAAISFAFPGPADYPNGIIGDLPNFPSFRGGVALGPMLQNIFGIPVFINNDGSLFAYGEALAGALPKINERLKAAGSVKRYRNLLGITLGTGFGAGVVVDGHLLVGDNSVGGDVWCLRSKKFPDMIAEEGACIRAVKRVYREHSGSSESLEPKDIFDIAEGTRVGDVAAARASFAELGEQVGDAVATAVTLTDSLVVIGGGLSGAAKYFLPSLMKEMNGQLSMAGGKKVGRLQMRAFNLEDEEEFKAFAKGEAKKLIVPRTGETIDYDPLKRIGVAVSEMGTSRAVAMGAYVYALNQLA